MAYIKAIISGNDLELYSYEQSTRLAKRRRDISSGGNLSGVSFDGSSRRSAPLQGESEAVFELRKKRAVVNFKRLVRCQLAKLGSPVLVTLTYARNETSLDRAYRDFQAYARACRHTFGQLFRYIAVPEFQKRGAVHFHTFVWGFPHDICEKERDTRLVASLWGQGYVDCTRTDGREALIGYLSKYMAKSFSDERLFGKKSYRCSRNVFRPIVEKGLTGLWYLSEVYGIGGVDNPPLRDVEYMTQWLGKGRFRLYKIKIPIKNGNQNISENSFSRGTAL